MEWIDVLKNYWWLIVTFGAIIAYITKVTYQIYCFKDKLHHIEEKQKGLQTDTSYLLRCSFATLDGLKQLNCNGKVIEMYEEMRKFVLSERETKVVR